MKKYVFVKSSFNWADEFAAEGCFVQEKQVFDDELSQIEEAFADGRLEDVEVYFGSNEAITFDCFEEYSRGLTVKECTKEFYLEFIELNGRNEHGHVFSLLEHIETDGEEDDEEDYE